MKNLASYRNKTRSADSLNTSNQESLVARDMNSQHSGKPVAGDVRISKSASPLDESVISLISARMIVFLMSALVIGAIAIPAINSKLEKKRRYADMTALHHKVLQDLQMGLVGCHLDPVTRDLSIGDYRRMQNYWKRASEEYDQLDAYDEKWRNSLHPNILDLSLAMGTIPGTLESRRKISIAFANHSALNHEEARIFIDFENGANIIAAATHGGSWSDDTNWERAPYPDVVVRLGRDDDEKRGYSDGKMMAVLGDFNLAAHSSIPPDTQLREFAARYAKESNIKVTIDYIDAFCRGYADARMKSR